MVKVKFCGLRRPEDIAAVNELGVDFAGFVFAKKSKRYVEPVVASELRKLLKDGISAVGVFVDEPVEAVAGLIADKTIDIAQLHGSEDDAYISRLKELLEQTQAGRSNMQGGKSSGSLQNMQDIHIIKAFKVNSEEDVRRANASSADMILLDSGAGSGKEFDWSVLSEVRRPYFLAGGLDAASAGKAIERLSPYALDVSSGIETDGFKDRAKMESFIAAMRNREDSQDIR
ncbi:MAG: phosphoribosylanthranilate isomerase [Lachnospiraceae bacterium]|nr:phosphoribosylanthranilate isomerase [Lachnospiraceae bacterium]